jgi:hypothetical protein
MVPRRAAWAAALLLLGGALSSCAGSRVESVRESAPKGERRGQANMSGAAEDAPRAAREDAPSKRSSSAQFAARDALPRLERIGLDAPGLDALLPSDRSSSGETIARYGELEIRRADLFDRLREREPGKAQELLELVLLDARVHELAQREAIELPAGELDLAVRRELARVRRGFDKRPGAAPDFESFLARNYGLSRSEFEQRARLLAYRRLMRSYAVRYWLRQRGSVELELFVAATREAAEAAREQVRLGAEFGAVARRSSIHASAARGGRLPPLPPDVEHPALALAGSARPGSLSPLERYAEGDEPVGFAFVRVLGREAPDPRSFAEQREEIRKGLAARPIGLHEIALFVSGF